MGWTRATAVLQKRDPSALRPFTVGVPVVKVQAIQNAKEKGEVAGATGRGGRNDKRRHLDGAAVQLRHTYQEKIGASYQGGEGLDVDDVDEDDEFDQVTRCNFVCVFFGKLRCHNLRSHVTKFDGSLLNYDFLSFNVGLFFCAPYACYDKLGTYFVRTYEVGLCALL